MEPIRAAALVSQPALYGEELLQEHLVGPAMVHPSEMTVKGPIGLISLKEGLGVL